MIPEDVVRKALREALLKEMMAIDDYIKVTQKRRRELATFRFTHIRSAITELKGKGPYAANKETHSSCHELYQQSEETSVTTSIIDKENEVGKDTKEKCCDKAKEVDKPTKEEAQEDNIKKEELEK